MRFSTANPCRLRAVPPSGHHARTDRATGFCYLNNSAIAAQRLRSRYGKVAVLDVDAHHGDGTQEIFYRRADVLTVSVHVDPNSYYPYYIGYADERGHGEGEGYNINIPLAPKASDATFHAAVDEAAKKVRAFGAEALVVALGYDSHREDPIGLLDVSTEGFAASANASAPSACPRSSCRKADIRSR